ncbi:hypothetical protein F5880DRAFT_1609403 [Lentinula raphanica]|nr:hypothetical protein F5880DRAFT_1609403 [Lentinula raphanica]
MKVVEMNDIPLPAFPPIEGKDVADLTIAVYGPRDSSSRISLYRRDRLAILGNQVLNLIVTDYLFQKQPLLEADDFQDEVDQIIDEDNLLAWIEQYPEQIQMFLQRNSDGALYVGAGMVIKPELKNWVKKLILKLDMSISSIPEQIVNESSSSRDGHSLLPIYTSRPYSSLATPPTSPTHSPSASPPTNPLAKDHTLFLVNQTAAQKRAHIQYRDERVGGPDHVPEWVVYCQINGEDKGSGRGRNKKSAMRQAAKVAILANAPTDIARIILEFAAQNDRATAASISLVSREVNAWITPILYRTVEFRKCAEIDRAEQGYPSLRYTRTLILLDTEQYLENGLYTFRVPDPELLLNHCPDLSELHISENTVRGTHDYTLFKQLRRLIVHGRTFLRPGEFFFLPLYPSLTHLAFIHDIPRNFTKDAGKAFPNLTHFACSYRVHGANSETPTLETSDMLAHQLGLLLDNVFRIPSLRVVIIVVQDFAQKQPAGSSISDEMREVHIRRLLRRVPQRNDGKVASFYLTSEENKQHHDMPDPELWDVSSKRSFWRRAEEIVRLNIVVEWSRYWWWTSFNAYYAICFMASRTSFLIDQARLFTFALSPSFGLARIWLLNPTIPRVTTQIAIGVSVTLFSYDIFTQLRIECRTWLLKRSMLRLQDLYADYASQANILEAEANRMSRLTAFKHLPFDEGNTLDGSWPAVILAIEETKIIAANITDELKKVERVVKYI